MSRSALAAGIFAVLLFMLGCPSEPEIDPGVDGGQGGGNTCEAVDCSGHGTCVDGACDCMTGYTGASCGECAQGFELRAGLCLL